MFLLLKNMECTINSITKLLPVILIGPTLLQYKWFDTSIIKNLLMVLNYMYIKKYNIKIKNN